MSLPSRQLAIRDRCSRDGAPRIPFPEAAARGFCRRALLVEMDEDLLDHQRILLDADEIERLEDVEVGVEIQRTAKTPDQRHRSSVRRLVRQSGLLDQARGDHAVDDAKHLAHDRPAAGEQETQRFSEFA